MHLVCHECRASPHPMAAGWIAMVTDSHAYMPLAGRRRADPLAFVDDVPYAEQVDRARLETGSDESVLGARGRIGGHDVVVIAFDFNFLGGSLGVAAGQAIVEALEIAAGERRSV